MNRFFLVTFCWLFGAGSAAATEPVFHPSAVASVLAVGGDMMNGDHFADSVLPVMRAHYAGVRKVALVLYATLPAERDHMEARLQKAFAHLGGIAAESLHRHDAAGQRALLESAEGIFVGGGETFVLLSELYRTGQLELIPIRFRDEPVFVGASLADARGRRRAAPLHQPSRSRRLVST